MNILVKLCKIGEAGEIYFFIALAVVSLFKIN
jgi:hypothetical protein